MKDGDRCDVGKWSNKKKYRKKREEKDAYQRAGWH
jgi:hypothetical protein